MRVLLQRYPLLLVIATAGLWPRMASSQVQVKAGDLPVVTVGAPSQSITGLGFQPDAVIFFWTQQTASGFSSAASIGYGFATDSTHQAAVAYASDNNQATTVAKRWQSQSRCIVILSSAAAGTADAEATFTSMDADGFTLNWVNKGSLAWRVHYLAIGGPDLLNSTVGSFTPAAGTGSETITGVGFEPDFLMFLSIDSNTLDAPVSDAKVSIGFAGRNALGSISNGAVTAVSGEGAANSKSFVRQRLGRAILERNAQFSSANETMEAEVTAFAANEFTIEKYDNDAATETLTHYLALRGAQYKVGAITKPATEVPPNPAFSTTTTGVGFQPSALFFLSKNIASGTNANEEGRISLSVSDGTNERATVFHDKNSADPTKVRQANSVDKVIFLAQADCPEDVGVCSGTERVISEADVTSFGFDGFSLNWTTNIISSPPLNDPSNENNAEILYLAIGRTWPDLQTSEGAGTFTVTAPDWFEMTFSEVTGWGMNLFYDLAEDPTRTYDLAGTPGGSVQALNHFGLRHPTGPTWYNASRNDLDPKLDVIEATPTRVKLRQESFFQEAGTSNILGGVKGIGDHTIYPTGKSALRWNRTTTTSVDYIEQDLAVGVHREASGPLNDLTGYSETGLIPTPPPAGNPGTDTFILMERDVAGVRTDFLVILEQSWALANRIDFTDANAFASWRDTDAGTAGASETWNFLTYFKPTDFVDHADAAVTTRRSDYQTPDPLAVISPGAGWDENGDANFFHEGEAAYGFDLDPSLGLTFDIHGDVTPRYSPFFKIRQWRSLREPDDVTLNGIPLTNGLHYKADVKPVSDADFAADILFHTTLESFAAVTSPDIGDGTGSGQNGIAYVAARYGSGAQFDNVSTADRIDIPLIVNGRQNFEFDRGRIELWYQPNYNHTDNAQHYLLDAEADGVSGGARIRIKKESDVSSPGKPNWINVWIADSTGTYQGVEIPDTNYRWQAGEWVHVALEWDSNGPADNVRIYLNGTKLVPQFTRDNTFTMAPESTSGFIRLGNNALSAGFTGDAIIDELTIYSTPQTPTRLSRGGLLGDPSEYLADGSGAKNFSLAFTPVDLERRGEYLYLGSDSKFRGLNVALDTPGSGTLPNLQWQYWNGTGWANLSTGFIDGTSSLTENGTISWSPDPAGWSLYSVNGSTDLYYVRAYLASGSYSTSPIEGVIKTDILLFQYNGDITAANQTFDFGVPTPTSVELLSFEARGGDSVVELNWETASELDNLGFHLYRAISKEGPYTRLTARLIPGLGSSPSGAKYIYRDTTISNGTTYFYHLEDVESSGRTERHGPVSATPQSGAGNLEGGSEISTGSEPVPALITIGDPSANRFAVLEWSERGAVVELVTEGFYAEPLEDGSVRLLIPDFEPLSQEGWPTMPVTRPWLDAVAGSDARVVSFEESSVATFSSLRPSGAEQGVLVASTDGVVRTARKVSSADLSQPGVFPDTAARVLATGFQGETKKVQLELAPLRWDGDRRQLRLATRLSVYLSFSGKSETWETRIAPSTGRYYRPRDSHSPRRVLKHLVVRHRGLHVLRFEEIFSQRGRALPVAGLSLDRLGEPVPFFVQPREDVFGPGSRLYFFSPGPDVNPYGNELVYELRASERGITMSRASASSSGASVSHAFFRSEHEVNRFYQAGLLDAPDVWLWDVLLSPVTKSYSFDLEGLAAAATESAQVSVLLQGASDHGADHHVRLYVNGAFLGESFWRGKKPVTFEAAIPVGVLLKGSNTLAIENVGDTAAGYSMVFLDRFTVDYPHLLAAERGLFEGRFTTSGWATVSGVASPAFALDLTDPGRPRWLNDILVPGDGTVQFRAEAGRRYLVSSASALFHPEIRAVSSPWLKTERHRADYLVITPRTFLDELRPLLELRREQGLLTETASVEQIYQEFGFGESRPEAIGDFLSYAFHNWTGSLRYVLLVGDGTYDFKGYLKTSVVNQLPPLMVKTSYLWTASDPTLAAVNGEDLLPDVAVGRLPAANEVEVHALVNKIVVYETGARDLSAPLVLVSDNPDTAGNFVADVEDIASGVLAGKNVQTIHLAELGVSTTRARILQAFDDGALLVSYVGHGGIPLWAHENIFHAADVSSLQPQAIQPLFVTMNCLNGYFVFPYFNSLSEELLKADEKGVIAAFSPTGLSLDAPAHRFHQELLDAVFNQGHHRLGDAVLAAQEAYAASGAFPELLTIYHLLGDPALTLRSP